MTDNLALLSEYRSRRQAPALIRPVLTEGLIATWSANTDNTHYILRAGWEEMYGPESVRLLRRQGWIRLVHPADKLAAVGRMTRGRASGEPYMNQYRALLSGIYRPVAVLVFPVKDGTGRIIRWEGYNQRVDEKAVNF